MEISRKRTKSKKSEYSEDDLMEIGLVSVVLPIYNVEKYLDRCIKSVVNQTYKNLEIILVDDGSPDNCPMICDVWAKKDDRIKVIHKKNAGLGMARNTGIENATGEYICFFDSDDYVETNTIELCINEINRSNSQIVLFGINSVNERGFTVTHRAPDPPKSIYEGVEVQNIFLPMLVSSENNIMMSSCCCLYSMSLLRDINFRFVSERKIIAEDIYSLLVLYKYVNRVSIIPYALYNYCLNQSSLTHTYREDRYPKIKYFYSECVKVCDNFGYGEDIKKRLTGEYYGFVLAAMKMIAKSNNTKKKKIILLNEILHDKDFTSAINTFKKIDGSLKKKVMIIILELKWSRLLLLIFRIKAN